MLPMLGWFSEASTLASRSKRARRSGSDVNASGSTFSATSRSSLVSLGLIHLAHAALADLGGDGIRAERGAGLQRHQLWDGHEALEFLEPVLDHVDIVLTVGRRRLSTAQSLALIMKMRISPSGDPREVGRRPSKG